MNLINVEQAASLLGVSVKWVRRHIAELPVIRMGRLIRLNADALSQLVEQNSLKPERSPMISRYQRGFVYQRGRKKVWYGIFREDIRTSTGMERRQLQVRLGTPAELPTKNAARNKLTELMTAKEAQPSVAITFSELVNRWSKAEGPTMKESTFAHYLHALHKYVVPAFGDKEISGINREQIQAFLAAQAQAYSASSLRSMRVVLGLTLGWAEACRWIERNPCVKIKLPKQTGGRRVKRTVLTPEQVGKIAGNLEEPYATLVILLYVTGLRISEAVALQWADLQDGVLSVSRRIYERKAGEVKSLKSVRKLPLDAAIVERIGKLHSQFPNSEWMFQSEVGTPVDPRNALNRYVRPAVADCGIVIGGWHDFRHTLSTSLRRAGVHPKVVSDILGHSKVDLAMNVYDRTDLTDLVKPLVTVTQMLPSVTKASAAA